MISIQELLIPRKLVAIKYPYSPFDENTVLTKNGIHASNGMVSILWKTAEECTEVFLDLQWWEYRNLQDLPDHYLEKKYGKPVKVLAHHKLGIIGEDNVLYEYSNLIPISEEDYIEKVRSIMFLNM